MKTPLLLLIALITLCTGVNEGIEADHLDAAIGSSVTFLGVKIDKDTVFDLLRGRNIIMACHGACKVREPYTQRGHFNQDKGTFELRDLRAEDSGTYEYKTNLTLNRRVHLRVMAPVMVAVLLKQEGSTNSSQCQITFTCHATGDGPFNFTYYRNQRKVFHEVGSDTTSSLSIDGWDPGTSGKYSCMVANPVSSKISPHIELLTPVTENQTMIASIVIGLFLQWGVAILYSLICCVNNKWQQRQQRHDGEGSLSSIDVFTQVDGFLGFFKEILAALISIFGGFIPVWWCTVPVSFFLCRIIYWVIPLLNQYRDGGLKFLSFMKSICFEVMWFSSVCGVPSFCVAVLLIFWKRYCVPCGVLDPWTFYISLVPIIFLILLVLLKLWKCCFMDKVKAQAKQHSQETRDEPQCIKDSLLQTPVELPSHVSSGGIGQPQDWTLKCKRNVSDVVVDIPNNHPPEREASCENMTEEGSEDHRIPKPRGGQPQVEEKSCVRIAPSYGTKDRERPCQPQDNKNPNCKEHMPNSTLGSPEQEASCENTIKQGPEDHQIPKPEGQPQVAKEIPCKSHVRATTPEDSDDPENREGQCLLTEETKAVALDKDRVANG